MLNCTEECEQNRHHIVQNKYGCPECKCLSSNDKHCYDDESNNCARGMYVCIDLTMPFMCGNYLSITDTKSRNQYLSITFSITQKLISEMTDEHFLLIPISEIKTCLQKFYFTEQNHLKTPLTIIAVFCVIALLIMSTLTYLKYNILYFRVVNFPI